MRYSIIRNVSVLSGAPFKSLPTIVRSFNHKEDAEKSLEYFKSNSSIADAYSLYDNETDNPHFIEK